jgi:hypothetical protein
MGPADAHREDDPLETPPPPPENPAAGPAGRNTRRIALAVAAIVVAGAAAASVAVIGGSGDPSATAPPATGPPATAPSAVLAAAAPGTAHEAIPHGVPEDYDWQPRATGGMPRPPSNDSRYVNLWGHLYADESNVRPANTRVSIAACELWRLPASEGWQRVQGGPSSRIEGGAWSEDYTDDGGPFSLRNESVGQSTVTADGYNSHFWTRDPLFDSGTGNRAFVGACSARLVLADPGGVDDRGESRYVVGVGVDWRESDYGCPSVDGTTVCTSLGVGRFYRVTNEWRRVIFTTSDVTEGLPGLPAEALRNPDETTGN